MNVYFLLHFLDVVTTLFDGVAGVDPHTKNILYQDNKYNFLGKCFLNKMNQTISKIQYCVGTTNALPRIGNPRIKEHE